MENKTLKTLRSGLLPNKHDRRDYSFFKTKRPNLGGVYPTFPENYSTDVGLWMPDQNAMGLPFGCTSFAQTDLLIDEDKKLYDVWDIENITHSNQRGGIQLREALKAVTKLHPDHPAFFNVRPDIPDGGQIDWFDAVRLAIVIGKGENRAVSIGTPWFPSFNAPQKGIIQKFLDWALNNVGWHNWVIKGWKTIDGKVYLIGKPWCGKNYGDGGYAYFDRTTFNRLMGISGTVAFVLDKLMEGETVQKVDSTAKQWLVAFFYGLFSKLGSIWTSSH